MTSIITINKIDNSHLENVKSEMMQLGSPTIKAVWAEVYNAFVALEGSHRIAAAAELGITVVIDEVEYSDSLISDLGIDDSEDNTIENYVDTAWQRSNLTYDVETK